MNPILWKNIIKVLHARSQKRLFAYYAALALILVFFQLFFIASASAFQVGDRVKATENLNVRNCTFLWCDVIGVIPQGGTGRIIGGSYFYDNYTWWSISWDSGLTGFSIQNYLAVIPGTFSLSNETPVCDTGSPGPSPAVRLNWTTSNNADYYDVYCNGSLYASSNTSNTFYNSANLVAGQTYTYYIKARNSSGSQNSNTISVSIPSNICDSATKPTSFTLNQPSTSCNSINPQIALSWGSSSNATSYKVYRNEAYYDNAYTSLTYKNTSVVSGTTYSYFIRASNSAGYRDSNTVTATAPNCVASPQITIGPSSLNFDSAQAGSCSSAQFAIQHVVNTGTASGTVTISQNPPFRVTSNSSFSLSNGQAVNVNVEFCPTSSGSFSGTAVINSNANQNINSVNLSGTGSTPSPTTGVIQVNAKLDGTSWSGSVNYSISGAQNFSGNTVPADFQDRQQGNYTLAYVSGGPANSTFSSITPSSSQTLNGGGVITFTLNFIAQTSNQSPVAKFAMTSGDQTAYEDQTLNLAVTSGGTAQVSFSGSRSSDPDGSISSYLWKINGANVSTSRDFSSSLGKGTHQVYLTVTDNKGAVGSVGGSIAVTEQTSNQSPVAKFTMTSGGQSAYENQTLNLTVSSGGTAQVDFSGSRSSDPDGAISSYLWTINGIQVSTSRDFSSSLGKGTHQVYLTVTDNQGAEGSVGANIVIEETTSSTTTTSTTTSTTTTTSISTSTISTTSTPTSTTSTTTTTLPVSSTIGLIIVPDIKKDYLSILSWENRYKFKVLAKAEITISLFSTDFNTFLSLKNNKDETLAEDDDGHIDYGESESFDYWGTNSEISTIIDQGTYTIWVTRSKDSENQGGEYLLVVRDILEKRYHEIQTICEKRNDLYPAVFPGLAHSASHNSWDAEWALVGGDDCVGRCGKGNLEGFLDCWNSYRYTRDCFNHDVCVGRYGQLVGQTLCSGLLDDCLDDCVFSEDCGPDLNVGVFDSCDYSMVQKAMDSGNSGTAIKLQSGIWSEHLTSTPATLILRGGWDETFTNDSSTSTVNSLTVTDGKVIVDNLVIQ